MYTRHFKANKSLINLVDQANNQQKIKRSSLYLEWISKQSKLFNNETLPILIPDIIFPEVITSFAYNKNNISVQTKINKYYNYDQTNNKYLRNNQPIDLNDSLELLHNLVFLRGNVVWVEFGFNVGCEFGGKHPAIILKNLGKALIVVPLTSGTLRNQRSSEVVIDMVFNLPKRNRYINVTRITPISVYRVDLYSPMGSIRSTKMREIFAAIINEWN